MSVRKTLLDLKAARRKAFIPYITAGDPSLEATESFVRALSRAGANVIELGIPFSDPMADGPVNQRSSERALRNGVTLRDVLGCIKRIREDGIPTPLVLFTYLNPVLNLGYSEFSRLAREAGANAALILDLPLEEAGDYRRAMAEAGLETIFLASPTTTEERLRLINEASTGFVYYVSRVGVTGAQMELSTTLREELVRVRRNVTQPIAVGFGISEPAHALAVAENADAVVVGSALVRKIEENEGNPAQAGRIVEDFARSFTSVLEAGKLIE